MDDNMKKAPVVEQPKKEEVGKPKEKKTPPKPRVFLIDVPLRNAVVNLIGAGSYNNTPPVPSRDVLQIVAALNNLRPYDLKIEQKPAEGETATPPHQMRVFIMDEMLRNTVVNLLGAGTFSHIPAAEVIRIVSILSSLRPFDVSTEPNGEKKPEEKKPGLPKEDDKKK